MCCRRLWWRAGGLLVALASEAESQGGGKRADAAEVKRLGAWLQAAVDEYGSYASKTATVRSKLVLQGCDAIVIQHRKWPGATSLDLSPSAKLFRRDSTALPLRAVGKVVPFSYSGVITDGVNLETGDGLRLFVIYQLSAAANGGRGEVLNTERTDAVSIPLVGRQEEVQRPFVRLVRTWGGDGRPYRSPSAEVRVSAWTLPCSDRPKVSLWVPRDGTCDSNPYNPRSMQVLPELASPAQRGG